MNNKRGFTLIEVISVLAIMGLLATIIVASYMTLIKSSRKGLNEEQKSRLVEVAKNVSLNNKTCLELAKNATDGVKITLDQMKKNGYIANNQLKDLEDDTLLNSCIVITWDEVYNKFDYAYSEECSKPQSCIVTAESEKVIVSSFYVGESNTNYINQRNANYYMRYSASITAEYCVTLGNEASCSWKKLSTSATSVTGNLNLTDIENVVHLYIRNSNKNIIAAIDDTIIFDSAAPTCVWKAPTKSYVHNGSSTEITLRCSDVAGIKNVELLASAINVSNPSLASVSDAVVTTNGTNKEFKFFVYGLEGNGDVTLSLNPGIVSDTSGNFVSSGYVSSTIYVDNVAPTGDVTIGDSGGRYTNTERVLLRFSNVSSDVEKMCISNYSEGNCTFVNYAPTYTWTLNDTDGVKTIYVSLADRAGNVMNKAISIHLDRVQPNCIATPTSNNFNLKNGSYIDYVINCTDNNRITNTTLDTSMILIDKQGNSDATVSVVGSNQQGTTIRVKALTGNGKAIVLLKANAVYDEAGNGNSITEIANVVVDNIPPVNNSIAINYNSTITHLRGTTISLNSELRTEGGYYCLSLNSNVDNCTTWNNYTSIGTFNLGSTAGTYTLYAFFKDLAGNVSSTAVSDSIKYNPDAISCILTLQGDTIYINYSDPSKLADLPYSVDMVEWTSNNSLSRQPNKYTYFSYIKDKNGEINYCDLNLSE